MQSRQEPMFVFWRLFAEEVCSLSGHCFWLHGSPGLLLVSSFPPPPNDQRPLGRCGQGSRPCCSADSRRSCVSPLIVSFRVFTEPFPFFWQLGRHLRRVARCPARGWSHRHHPPDAAPRLSALVRLTSVSFAQRMLCDRPCLETNALYVLRFLTRCRQNSSCRHLASPLAENASAEPRAEDKKEFFLVSLPLALSARAPIAADHA